MPAYDYDFAAARKAVTGSATWEQYPDTVVDRMRALLKVTFEAKRAAGIGWVRVESSTLVTRDVPSNTSEDLRGQLFGTFECEAGVYRTLTQMLAQAKLDLDALNGVTTDPNPKPTPAPSTPAPAPAPAPTPAPAKAWGGKPKAPVYDCTWTSSDVTAGGKMKATQWNWQSASPSASAAGLKVALRANGEQRPASGASASSYAQRCEVEPNCETFEAGETRYFRLDVRLEAGFPTGTGRWQLICQWKQTGEGSPPVELCVGNGKFYLVGHDSKQNVVWTRNVGSASAGRSYSIVVGLTFGTSNSSGRVTAYVDGQNTLAAVGLLTAHSGKSQYWKVGVYRDKAISEAAAVTFTRVAMAKSFDDVK